MGLAHANDPFDEIEKTVSASGEAVFAEDEDEKLRQLGIRRELRREFSSFSTLSFALGVIGCAASVASTLNTPLLLGGPATVVWAWLLGSFGCICIALSVAEIISAYPTAGGIYTSTAFIVPKRYRASVCFVSAWITIMGQLACPASGMFALSQMIFSAITIATDGVFIATSKQILGLYVGLIVFLGVMNSLPTRFLHKIYSFYVYLNIGLTLAVIIAVPASGAGSLASHEFVWTTFIDNSGWGNKGFVFLLGLLSVQWVMTDYDGTAHISEEVKNAAVAAPVAIVSSVSITAVLGFFVNVAMCYGIRDYDALPGPTGLAFAQILWDNLGKRGALAMWSFVILALFVSVGISHMACVRSIYAISRDNALPDKRLLSKIWQRTGTPVYATIFSVIIITAFGLLGLASLVAANAIFSIVAVALDVTYMVPIVAKVYAFLSREKEERFVPGPFTLGNWGYLVNIYAISWTCLETGVLIMPQVRPVTAQTMNYAAPIMGAVCIISWLWYTLVWHRFYHGPGSMVTPVPSTSKNSLRSLSNVNA